MTDRISPKRRSWNMSRIKSKNTSPEMKVRSALHSMGYRFRLHDSSLPGTPDIILKKHRIVIFVHGCYWHRHDACKAGQYFPKSPRQGIKFWEEKFTRNVARDSVKAKLLEQLGWKVLVIWECETTNRQSLLKRIEDLLNI